MQARNPDYRQRVAGIIDNARFIRNLGLQLNDCGPGWCETRLAVTADHWQQDEFIHAGVQATVADHTAGSAGFTLLEPDEIILTAEFKINLLRPAVGTGLRCRAEVLKPGRTLIVVESAVYADTAGKEVLTAKAMVTLAVVHPETSRGSLAGAA